MSLVIDDQAASIGEAHEAVAALNRLLLELGLPRLEICAPDDCESQDINARYMDQQQMQRLVENIQRDGRLESVPLVAPPNPRTGKYPITSGHHRISAAQKAGRPWIIVMITDIEDEGQLRAKQLSHNAITGKDDEVLLKKMYESISTLEDKLYSGLADEIASISVVSLNFRAGTFKEFVVAFAPEEIQYTDQVLEQLGEELVSTGSGSTVRLADLKDFSPFADAIRKVKKSEEIKSNAAAFARLVELAAQKLQELQDAEAQVLTGEEP